MKLLVQMCNADDEVKIDLLLNVSTTVTERRRSSYNETHNIVSYPYRYHIFKLASDIVRSRNQCTCSVFTRTRTRGTHASQK